MNEQLPLFCATPVHDRGGMQGEENVTPTTEEAPRPCKDEQRTLFPSQYRFCFVCGSCRAVPWRVTDRATTHNTYIHTYLPVIEKYSLYYCVRTHGPLSICNVNSLSLQELFIDYSLILIVGSLIEHWIF